MTTTTTTTTTAKNNNNNRGCKPLVLKECLNFLPLLFVFYFVFDLDRAMQCIDHNCTGGLHWHFVGKLLYPTLYAYTYGYDKWRITLYTVRTAHTQSIEQKLGSIRIKNTFIQVTPTYTLFIPITRVYIQQKWRKLMAKSTHKYIQRDCTSSI